MGLLVVSTDVGGAPEVLPSALVTFAKELGLRGSPSGFDGFSTLNS